MINYGVVGVGYFGAELARFMNMHDNAKITCVYDPENGENIARELQYQYVKLGCFSLK